MAYKLNNKTLQADRGFTHNGIQYPRNWLKLSSQGDRDAIGITWEADPVRADDRYYWDGDVNNPKALDNVDEVVDGETTTTYGLKHTMTAQVKDTAGKLLATTDWYITRQVERQVPVPPKVTAKRQAIVQESERLEISIKAITTVEELINVMNTQNWGE
jgi:hypothetical protein